MKPSRSGTLELEIDQLKSCDGWNGNFKVKGNKLTVTNVDYNGEIAKGGSTSIGCNIGTGTKLNVKSAKLNGVVCTVKKGKVSQNNKQITTIIRIMTRKSLNCSRNIWIMLFFLPSTSSLNP